MVAALPLARFGSWEIDDTDISLVRAPWQLARTLTGAWNPNGFGFDQTRSRALLFPTNLVFGLFQVLHVPLGDRTQLWLGLLVGIAGAGMWWFIAGWLNQSTIWNVLVLVVAGVGYMFSSFVILLATDTTMFVLPYTMLPWLLGVIVRVAEGRMQARRGVALLALLICCTSALDIPLLIINVLATTVFGLAIARRNALRRQVLTIASGVALGFCSLAWTLGPTAWSALRDPGQAMANLAAESVNMYDAHTSPLAVAHLQGYWALYSGYADRAYRPYQGYYLDSLPGAYAGYLLLGLGIMGLVVRRRSRIAVVLALLGLISWRLVVGVYPSPLLPGSAAAFRWGFAHVPLASVFRDTFKFMTVLTVAVVALAAAGIAQWADSRRTAGLVRVAGLCVFAVAVSATAAPVWAGQLWWPDKGTQAMPTYWTEAASWLNSRPEPASERLLLLPDMPFPVYTWGTPPTEPTMMLVHRWQVFPVPGTNSVQGGKELDRLFAALDAVPRAGGSRLARLLSEARIRYLLVRRDMRTGYYPNVPSAEQTERDLSRVRGVRKVSTFGQLAIYRFEGPVDPLVGCVTATGGDCATSVRQSQPATSFEISLSDAGAARLVQLNQSYDRGWSAVGHAGTRNAALDHVKAAGIGNVWRVAPWVRRVSITYEPSAALTPAWVVSGLASALAVFLLFDVRGVLARVDLRRFRRMLGPSW